MPCICMISDIKQKIASLSPYTISITYIQLYQLFAGGSLHVSGLSHGAGTTGGNFPFTLSIFTSTGIICPVPNLNSLCPNTTPC